MSDETKEIIESQLKEMREELADVHTNVGRILECLDTMVTVIDRGKRNGFASEEIDALWKLHLIMFNAAKRCC